MQTQQDTKNIFFEAQNRKKKIHLTYFSGQHNLFLTKLCVPIQYVEPISQHGPEFYYFWNDESDVGERLFGLPPSEIKYIEITDEIFEPKDYIIHYTGNL